MAKIKKAYFCRSCGNESPKWFGHCTACDEWNTCTEELISTGKASKSITHHNYKSLLGSKTTSLPRPIQDIDNVNFERIELRIQEVDRVLGGGLVRGSVVLIGGEPGIGKSTLALQIALKLEGVKILYVSGEESSQQIKMRAQRIGIVNQECYIYSETNLENILNQAIEVSPDIIVIDSIQTLYSELIDSSAGSVSQIRESSAMLLRYAKESSTPIILIGHITKDGSIAGPKVLEHIVDVVLQFDGDANNMYRVLRSIKNRFGSTNEIGVFEMIDTGLREVSNPSDILVSHYEEPLSGVAIGASLDGNRAYVIETQALVSSSAYATAQRSSTGFDYKRMGMLLAVLEKRLGFKLSSKDVFLNIAGGMKINDTGLDLALVAAIISSALDVPISDDICFAAEIGLSGEVRPASHTEIRVAEASRLGFKSIVISSYARKSINKIKTTINIIYVSKVSELANNIFDRD